MVRTADAIVVVEDGRNHAFRLVDRLAAPPVAAEGGRLTAPIPARLARIMVAVGDRVERGAPLLVLEAMKMEITVVAPAAGTVSGIPHRLGDMVQEGAVLVTFSPAGDDAPGAQG